jgi:DNA primase
MREDLEQLKQRIPLLQYLQRRHWTGCRVAAQEEFVGLCPLHPDTRPSFYVNARKNVFYCHGCHRGGDLIRFVELSEHLSFGESLACLKQDIALAAESELLTRTATFFQVQLHRCSEAIGYLQKRGLQDPVLVEELGLGYAPGGNLRRHLADFGYSPDLLLRTGFAGVSSFPAIGKAASSISMAAVSAPLSPTGCCRAPGEACLRGTRSVPSRP